MTRIAFIGAGSVLFTLRLVEDLLSYPDLGELELSLHDVDPERLETAEALVAAAVARRGAPVTVHAESDRRRALAGASFVINTIQVGGHEATLLDFEIPARHGLRQTIGDTLGIGGIFRALRTIPVMQSIAHDMADVCPDAWLLNYTNPMAMLCTYVFSATPVRNVVGLCHSVPLTIERLAAWADVPAAEVTFLIAGVNHQAHVLRIEHNSEDLYPRIDAHLAGHPELERTLRVALYRRFGYYQTESSEHAAEYVPWVIRHPPQIEHFRTPLDEYVRRSEENLKRYAATRRSVLDGTSVEARGGREYAAEIVNAIETNTPAVVYGNVRNRNAIPNLPSACCVEVPCLVDGTGLRPGLVDSLPPQLVALNRTYVNVCELVVAAAKDGRRDHVLHAALLDPSTAAQLPIDQIAAVVEELLEAHSATLPASLR